MAKPKFLKGEKVRLLDGREVQIVERAGDAWKAINESGMLEIVFPGQIKNYDMKGA